MATHFQLRNPLPEDQIVTTLKASVDVADIPGAILNPMEGLSFYFPVAPMKTRLHLVVYVPRRKHQSFTPSCQAN